MPSVFETTTGLLQRDDLLGRLASAVGGNQTDAAKVVNAAGPEILAGFAEKADAPGGPGEVGQLLDRDDGSVLADLGAFLDKGPTSAGASAASSVFGSKKQDRVATLAKSAGLGSGLVSSALPMLVPIVVGILAKRRRDDELSNEQVAALLDSERSSLRDSGLLVEAAGTPAAKGAQAATPTTNVASSATQSAVPAKPKVGFGWIWPAVGLVAVLVGLGWALTRLGSGGEDELTTSSSEVADTIAVAVGADSGAIDPPAADDFEADDSKADDPAMLQAELDSTLSDVDGADSVSGSVDAGGAVTLAGTTDDVAVKAAAETAATEITGVTSVDNQIEVSEGDEDAVAPELEIEPITFELNSAELTEAGKTSVAKAAAFFETYDDLNFEVGGHTDDDGSEAANQSLSESRAETVKAYLESKGITSERMTTKGYGKSEPKVANDSQENKAANRRIEFTVG